jgi:hypothetical protein
VRPWTPAEDDKIVEVTRIGLASDLWHHALPGRTFGEIAERRLQLREAGACPKTREI